MTDQTQILNRNYGGWPPVQTKPWSGFTGGGCRSGWKGKKKGGGYNKPQTVHEVQKQDLKRLKARKFHHKKKFNNRFAPFAPRNTTSFLIRAKKAGGIASLVSPCPVTPAILPTPMFSPSPEVLVDMAREEWGVNGYGSMNGLIRLREHGDREEEEDEEGDSSGTDVEEHVEVERRLNHDLSRFEMIYPNQAQAQTTVAAAQEQTQTQTHANLLENQTSDHNISHITHLEDENLTLKERLYLMEKELVDMRRRLQRLEAENRVKDDKHDEESENEGGGDICSEKSVGDGDCGFNGPSLM